MTAELAQRPADIDHRAVRERFGEADDWIGSVNDPRTREENGIRFNEKWIYYLPDGEQRWIYWHRYAFRGALRVSPDGSAREEEL